MYVCGCVVVYMVVYGIWLWMVVVKYMIVFADLATTTADEGISTRLLALALLILFVRACRRLTLRCCSRALCSRSLSLALYRRSLYIARSPSLALHRSLSIAHHRSLSIALHRSLSLDRSTGLHAPPSPRPARPQPERRGTGMWLCLSHRFDLPLCFRPGIPR